MDKLLAQRINRGLISLVLVISLLSFSFPNYVYGQLQVVIDLPDTAPLGILNALRVLHDESKVLNGFDYLSIVSYREVDGWALATLVAQRKADIVGFGDSSTTDSQMDGGIGAGSDSYLVIFSQQKDRWIAAIENTSSFDQLLISVPETFVSLQAKQALLPVRFQVQTGQQITEVKMPWDARQKWVMKSPYLDMPWHLNNGLNTPNNALDFAPNRNEVPSGKRWVLAAHDGVVSKKCDKGEYSVNLTVRHTDGTETSYFHLDKNRINNIDLGSYVVQGTVLGHLYNDRFDDDCGGSTGPHVHFVLPNHSIVLDGWTYSSQTIKWEKDGMSPLGLGNSFPSTNIARHYTLIGGIVKQAGSGLPVSNTDVTVQATDGQTTTTQTVSDGTYQFEDITPGLASVYVNYLGITITKQVDIKAKSTTPVPDIIIGICSSDQAAVGFGVQSSANCINPPQPVNSPPTPPPSSGQQVKLFRNNGYSDQVWAGGTGFTNEPNANSRSMDIPGGWSVKTWRSDNRSGEERCWTAPMPNLEDHGWQNTIQSIEVFNYNACSAAPPSSGGQVKLFSNNSYVSQIWAGSIGFTNDPSANSRSMEIPSGWSVKTWRSDNRGGEERCWIASIPNLEDHGWQNAIQSIEVFNTNACSSTPPSPVGQVKLYRNNGYGDQVWAGGTGFTNDPSANSRSMEIPSGWSVRTWRSDNRGGDERCWINSVSNLEDHGWHNAIQSIEVFSYIACPPPEIPANLRIASVTDSGITIAWDDRSSNENGFRIYRWDGADFGLLTTVGANVTTFTDAARPCNYSDFYKVSAFNNTGETERTGWVMGTTAACAPPAAPRNLTVMATSCSGVQLMWSDYSSNEDGFKVYRNGVAWAWVSADTVDYLDVSVSGNMRYAYEIRALRGNVESGSSNELVVNMPDCDTIPPDAAFLQLSTNRSINVNLVNLVLSASDDRSGISEAQFFAYYADSLDSGWHYLGRDTNAADGLDVQWDTSAIGDQKIGLWAYVWDGARNIAIALLNDVSLDRIAPASTLDALPATSPATFQLSWSGTDATSGIHGYDVQWRMNAGNWVDLQLDKPDVSASFTGVAGRNYEFRVRARDNAGNVEDWPATPDAQTTIQANAGNGPRYVSTAGSDDANACTNSAAPCRTIQHAVDAAQAGDEVRVAQGTYGGEVGADGVPYLTAYIYKSISLLGGYNATFTQRNPASNVTTLDGKMRLSGVILIQGVTALVDGFTIINGRAQQGAGIMVENWDGNMPLVTISNNVIEGNHTVASADNWGNGAGIFVVGNVTARIQSNRIAGNVVEDGGAYGAAIGVHWGAKVVIDGNQVLNNSTTQNTVGGIHIYSATAMISNNLIQGNRNVGVDAYDSPSVTIQGNTILSNSTSYEGGGIRIGGQTVFTVTQNTINGNSADGYDGGGIYIENGPRGLIERNLIINNRAATSGGGIAIYNAGGLITVQTNDLLSNISGWGSAVAVVNSTAAFEMTANSVLRNKTTEGDYQSGILLSDVTGPVRLINNVIAGNNNRGIKAVNTTDIKFINNTIVNNGAIGIEVLGWPTAPANPLRATLTNNIITGHADCGATAFNGAVIQATNNNFWQNGNDLCDAVSATNSIVANPLFTNAGADDLHLSNGSPAVDAGTNAGAPVNDKDGVSRPKAGTVDIGAYELPGRQIYLPVVVRKK